MLALRPFKWTEKRQEVTKERQGTPNLSPFLKREVTQIQGRRLTATGAGSILDTVLLGQTNQHVDYFRVCLEHQEKKELEASHDRAFQEMGSSGSRVRAFDYDSDSTSVQDISEVVVD